MKHLRAVRPARRVLASDAPTGGVNVSSPPHRIADTHASDMVNLIKKNGVLTTRPVLSTAGCLANEYLTSFTATPLGRYALVCGIEPYDQYTLGLCDGWGSVRSRWHRIPNFKGFAAVPLHGNPEADGDEAVVYLDCGGTDREGVYTLSAGGSLSQQLPYVPTVLEVARPTKTLVYEDNGVQREPFNRLTEMFRCCYTADGEGLYYWLPRELKLDTVTTVVCRDELGGELSHGVNAEKNGIWYEKFETESDVPLDRLSLHVDPERGCFWFEHASGVSVAPVPAAGANNITFCGLRKDSGNLALVCGMRFGTWYGGTATGTRVFLSGNAAHPNLVQWSALNDPFYLPENNCAYVGDAASAVTAFGKQGDMLVIFKETEVYATQYYSGGTVSAEALQSGAVTDMEAAAAVFPMVLVHPEIGCNCPDTLRLCGDRLVWLCRDGHVYALYSGGTYDVRSVRVLSQAIEAELRQHNPQELAESTAACYGDTYLLWTKRAVYALDGTSPGFTHYGSYGSAAAAQAAVAWYIWELPFGGTLTVADGRPIFLDKDAHGVWAHVLGEGTNDTVLGAGQFLPTAVTTKWYELGDAGGYKRLHRLRLWLTGDSGEVVTVSIGGSEVAKLVLHGTELCDTAPYVVSITKPHARYAAITLRCTGRMTWDRFELEYHRMGEMRE